MARRRPGQDLAVGAMFALALVVLALSIMAIGGDSGLFFDSSSYNVVFPTADGLVVGAPVRMAGVQIGTVKSIRLPTDPGRFGIQVDLSIDQAYAGRVRDDSRAVLRILQILTNEKFVEVLPGSLEQAQLPAGSTILPLEQPELLERGEAIAESLNDITISLKNILGPMERGEGLIGKMIQDPEFGEEGMVSLHGALENLRLLTGDLRGGNGLVGRLLTDRELAGRLDDLAGAIQSLTAIAASIERGDGAVGELLRDGGAAEEAIADMRDASRSLKRLTGALESDRGLLGRLLHDEEFSEGLAADLRQILGDAAEITAKINRGEGTLGALVNERALYDGAESVAAGVNDSKFARWLTRRYRKKGIKAQDREASSAVAPTANDGD